MRRLLVVVALLPCVVMAQEAKKEDLWKPLRSFVGKWEGTGSGMSGTSKVEIQFGFILNDKYLRVMTRAVFEPQEKNPQGEVHEDLGFISYDKFRQEFVFRQFHVERFVIQYVLDSVSADGKMLAFVSENCENAPPGTQVKLTYQIVGEDECHTSFEVAFPGQEFSCFSQNVLQRKK